MIDANKKISLKNLTNWALTFKRINSIGDVIVPPKGKITMLADEIMAQVYNNNRLFVGEDGKGSHARIFIEDEEVRLEAEFETKDGSKGETNGAPQKQEVLTDEKLKEIFSLKTLVSFKKNIQEKVVSQAEKSRAIEYAKINKINDHDKLEFLEKYTGFKLENA